MPQIELQFKGRVIFDYRDLADMENYKLLLALKEKFHQAPSNGLPIVFVEGKFLSGENDVQRELPALLNAALRSKENFELTALSGPDIVKTFMGFTPLAVSFAGLIDGINPCAFTVIVFFISFLSLQGYRRKQLVYIGLSFILAVFAAYLAMGLGAFAFLYRLTHFWIVSRIMNFLIGLFSISLGIAAVYDYLKFKKTSRTDELLLQLPESIKERIHRIIGQEYRTTDKKTEPHRHLSRLITASFVTGFIIAGLEAVCTGQTYLPTLEFILKTTSFRSQAAAYILLYNLMFIVPLLAVFMFALLGVTSNQFSSFLKKHLLTVKALMALLFLALGLFIIFTT